MLILAVKQWCHFPLLITDNVVSEAFVSQHPTGDRPANLSIDGDKTTCSKTSGLNVTFQVDLTKKSIVKRMYITFSGMLFKKD